MNPAQRNRVRHLRVLLDAYEHADPQRIALSEQIATAADELVAITRDAHDRHVAEVNARSAALLDGLRHLDG